ncbi:hypothetical protein [Inquilinus limosus]|uniref:Uncharacterized protein n=1 Tax=Inquilinus limosus TaxID=171674 RepID=A0A211ZHK2_9PROT|nr:hypothetical protein [Inquilinus limosus]OWJ64748.1 hypothetical protein BWR60_22935 [Inquilinus limosus]
MSKAKSSAVDPTIASDPELVRLGERIRSLQDLAERHMAEAEGLSKEPDKLMETFERFMQLNEAILDAISKAHELQKQYRRRRHKLETERARRLAAARAAFLAGGAPPGTTRH